MNNKKFTLDDLNLIVRNESEDTFTIIGLNGEVFTYPKRDKKSEYIKLMSDNEWKQLKELKRLNSEYVRTRLGRGSHRKSKIY